MKTCKYNVNHHGWAHHQGENQIHSFQWKDQWIHLTTDVKFSHLFDGGPVKIACGWLAVVMKKVVGKAGAAFKVYNDMRKPMCLGQLPQVYWFLPQCPGMPLWSCRAPRGCPSLTTGYMNNLARTILWKFNERMYSVLNHLEPTWTSLNLSWNNACEQLGNHFKFVGTDLWTMEPIGTYRNQVGTNLEPNGTSLCMEELGDGFSFVLWFLVFLDVVWPMS